MPPGDIPSVSPPAWASALGVVAIVLGVFFTAYQANEWTKQTVLTRAMPATGRMPVPDCPPEELEEEGLSEAECEYMVERVRGLALSTPGWFSGFQQWLAGTMAALAFVSVFVGGALVDYRPWAPPAAVAIFGGLMLLDGLQFAMVVNAGPVIREIYLWGTVLWFLLHMMMTVGAAAGRHAASTDTGLG